MRVTEGKARAFRALSALIHDERTQKLTPSSVRYHQSRNTMVMINVPVVCDAVICDDNCHCNSANGSDKLKKLRAN
jgi:23S rRNA-/tRNA-specific pseudouridylate synthase